ncbi:MAG: RNA polymerase sigma factor [Kiritimatiellae bacterium]|nr:RNA polymerase sigma factor [Kiritimatiellia bacterium]
MEIWQEIRKNGENGAKKLVSDYGNRLFAAAILLCADEHEAEELVFRTFDRVIKKIRQYEPTGEFFSWIYAIMLNFRRMDLRKRHLDIVPVGTPRDIPEASPSGVADLRRMFTREDVGNALAKISPLLREVVVLKYFEGRDIDEIAEMLTVPPGTVKSRLHNARKELCELLNRQKKEECHD